MSAKFRQLSPALALSIGALALVGCGGSSGGGTTGGTTGGAPLSTQAWANQIHNIFNELKTAAAPVRTGGKNPQTWFTLATKLKQIDSEVAALKPPPKAVGVNAAIVSGLAPLSGEATAIGNDIKGSDQTAAKQDATKFVRSLFGLLTKIATALQQVQGGGTST